MCFKTQISEKYKSSSGRKDLTETFCKQIEKVAGILRKKYKYDVVIAQYMDDLRQSFMIYLIEHESVWERSFSFESISSFFKIELDYFIGEQTESLRRSGYRTLARWVREALGSDKTFDDHRIKGKKNRIQLLFGLSCWVDEKPLFKDLYSSFIQFKSEALDKDAYLSFNPLTQTKPEFDQLVSTGAYDSGIDDQIRTCSEVLLDLSKAWCSVSELIGGFKEFWLELDGADESVGDDIAVRSAELDQILYDESANGMKVFLGNCSFLEVSILKAILSDKTSGKVKFQDVAKLHNVSSSTVSDHKKKLMEKLSKVLSDMDEGSRSLSVNALTDLTDSLVEAKNESL